MDELQAASGDVKGALKERATQFGRDKWEEKCGPRGLVIFDRLMMAYEKLSPLIPRLGGLMVKFRVLASFFQVVSTFDVTLSIKFPSMYTTLMDRLGSVVNIELMNLLPIGCTFPTNAVHSLVVQTALPALFVTGLYIASVTLNSRATERAKRTWHRVNAKPDGGHEVVSVKLSRAIATKLKKQADAASEEAEPDPGVASASDVTIEENGQPTPSTPKDEASSVTIEFRPKEWAAFKLDGKLDRYPYVRAAHAWFVPAEGTSLLASLLMDIAFYTVFLVYPGICQTIFAFFVCTPFDQPGEDGLSYLHVDLSVCCQDTNYILGWWYAGVAVLVYPIGVPLFYSAILIKNHVQLGELKRMELIVHSEQDRIELLEKQEQNAILLAMHESTARDGARIQAVMAAPPAAQQSSPHPLAVKLADAKSEDDIIAIFDADMPQAPRQRGLLRRGTGGLLKLPGSSGKLKLPAGGSSGGFKATFKGTFLMRQSSRLSSPQPSGLTQAAAIKVKEALAIRRLEKQITEDRDKATEELERLKACLPPIMAKLTNGYELRCFWFEVFNALRVILLIGTPILLQHYEDVQLVAELIICFACACVFVRVRPFESDSDDNLALICTVSTFFTLTSSIILKLNSDNPMMDALLCFAITVPGAIAACQTLQEHYASAQERYASVQKEMEGRTGRLATLWRRVNEMVVPRAEGAIAWLRASGPKLLHHLLRTKGVADLDKKVLSSYLPSFVNFIRATNARTNHVETQTGGEEDIDDVDEDGAPLDEEEDIVSTAEDVSAVSMQLRRGAALMWSSEEADATVWPDILGDGTAEEESMGMTHGDPVPCGSTIVTSMHI